MVRQDHRCNRYFEYCEDHWQDMEHDEQAVNTALDMFATARSKVPADTVYALRLALMDDFLDRLRSKAALLRQKRGPVPKLRLVWEPKEPIVIDGKLDDQYWRDCPTSSIGSLRELQTGRRPIFGTKVMSGWDRGSLYFGIRCEERPGEALNVATTKNEDQSIWYGDVVEIELDTDVHSYYQIAVNPSGALIDLDRGADKSSWFRWDSQAEFATHVAEDYWTVEIRIPITDDENDPLNQVIGNKPSQSLPWHFNVCRQRIRENGAEYSAFSPTGTAGFHEPMKFAYLHDGRSHRFDVDPTVDDYLISSSNAEMAMQAGRLDEALAEFVELSKREGLTELQKSAALSQAAACARALKNLDLAEELAEQIPLEVVAKTVHMENLATQRNWQELIAHYADEDLRQWPFRYIGAGAFERGRAYHAAGKGNAAEADLVLALAFTSDSRERLKIQRTLAETYEHVLEDEKQALQVYREIVQLNSNTGSSDYFHGIQGAARILARRGEYDQAFKVLDLIDIKNLSGYWRGSMLLARGSTLEAAERRDGALQIYRAMLNDPRVEARHKAEAKSRIEAQAQ